jgi:hypothetical protein
MPVGYKYPRTRDLGFILISTVGARPLSFSLESARRSPSSTTETQISTLHWIRLTPQHPILAGSSSIRAGKASRWVVPASKLFKKAPMRTKCLLLKGRGRWARVLNTHMDEAVLTHQLPLVAPLVKVTVPAPSKHINRMITTMNTKTYPWTRSQPSSLGPLYLLIRQLKASSRWWTIRGVSQFVQGKVHRSLSLAKGI